MANPACAPFAEPRPIQNADKADPTGFLGNAFRSNLVTTDIAVVTPPAG